MRKLPATMSRVFVLFFVFLLQFSVGRAQIDFEKDTVSKAEAMAMKTTYMNHVKQNGMQATERITLPVNKLKGIIDALAARGIPEVKVMIVSLRSADLAKYRKNHPGTDVPDAQLKGLQVLVFRIPRSAVQRASGSKINSPNKNPFMLGLVTAGLAPLIYTYSELPAGDDDYYVTLGNICPPPASCTD